MNSIYLGDQQHILNGFFSSYLDELWEKEVKEDKEMKLEELKVSRKVRKGASTKVCTCGTTYENKKRKCDHNSCGLPLEKVPPPLRKLHLKKFLQIES